MKPELCKTLVMLMIFFLIQNGTAQNINPPYPRVGILQMQRSPNKSDGALYKIASKYDLVVVSNSLYGPENYNVIRSENPNAVIINTRDKIAEGLRDQDALRDSRGDIVRTHFAGNFPNFTQYNSTAHEGAKIVAQHRLDYLEFPNYAWDGISWDNLNDAIYTNKASDVDFDRNGVNDFDEHGWNWVTDRWRESIAVLIQAYKDEMNLRLPTGSNYTFVNSGNFLKTWENVLNGYMYEGWMRYSGGWHRFIENYLTKRRDHLDPEIRFVDNYAGFGGPGSEKDKFQLMRYGLSATLLGDGFYGFESSGEYHFAYWYDEFDANLGYPQGPAEKLSVGGDEVWTRYFDLGAVICVPDAREGGYPYSVNVPASILSGGPYYRFKGGQDPKFNNGEGWNGHTFTVYAGSKDGRGVGDGILLFKKPTTIVADIIIDNYPYHATSPGNKEAQYTGNWEPLNSGETGSLYTDNPYYGMLFYAANGHDGTYRDKFTLFAYMVSSPDRGTAVYTPTINVSGNYEVFEWHGWYGDRPNDNQEATNVTYNIKHAGGSSTLKVNQQEKTGQWNSLGVYKFNQGTSGHLEISTQGANGFVISDAIKFVYKDKEDSSADIVPPNSPKNVKVDKANE